MAKRLAEQEKTKKAQIILLERFAPSFNALTDERAGQMVKGIFKYKISKQEPVFKDDVLTFFWQDIKHWLDESEAYYKQKCQTNKDNANARWKKNNPTDNANAYDRIQTDTNYPNANAMANARALVPKKGTIDSTNKGNSDFEKVLNLYREKIGVLESADEKNKLREIVETHNLDEIKTQIDFMHSQHFKGVSVLLEALDNYVDF